MHFPYELSEPQGFGFGYALLITVWKLAEIMQLFFFFLNNSTGAI